MKFLEKFSARISDPGFLSGLLRLPGRGDFGEKGRGAIASALQQGAAILDESSREEIQAWILSRQTSLGGFPDRGGNPDLYYTLFGFFLADALGLETVTPGLKEYVRKSSKKTDFTSIELFCLTILFASLFPDDDRIGEFKTSMKSMLKDQELFSNGYTPFLVCLSLLYLREYMAAWRALRSFQRGGEITRKPCPVAAAEQILAYLKAGEKGCRPDQILTFYRGEGGFAALHEAPSPDLLSTAVSLFALQFTGYDLRLLKPDCFGFVARCYLGGGFSSGSDDSHADIEYTFYGLLALGALNNSSSVNNKID